MNRLMTDDLIVRLRDFNERIQKIAEMSFNGDISPEGTSNAVALLTTTNAGLFIKIEGALRAASGLTKAAKEITALRAEIVGLRQELAITQETRELRTNR